MMSDPLDILFEAHNKRSTIQREDFESLLKDWEFHNIKDIAVVATKDNQIHAACLPGYEGRWLSRRVLRSILTPILSRFDFVLTGVARNCEVGVVFVHSLGFELYESLPDADVYILRKSNYKYGV